MKPNSQYALLWPVMLVIRVLNAVIVFFFFTVWGYRLPPRPQAADVMAWHNKHGCA